MTMPGGQPMGGLCIDEVTGQVSDPVATPLLAGIMQAVLDVYDLHPTLTAPCSWGLVSGAQMDVDRGSYTGTGDTGQPCAGLLTVQLGAITPTAQPDESPLIRRFSPGFWVHVTVGVWRPAAQPVETGDGLVLPSLEDTQEEAELTALDAAVVRSALLGWAYDQDIAVQLGTYLPWGPDGGIVGGYTAAEFEII